MSKPSAFSVPFCSPVVGSSPSAMRLLRSVRSESTPVAIALLSCSLVREIDHDDWGSARCVRTALPPDTTERYAGVNVYHCCPSPLSEKWGAKKYGWLKSRRMPRSSDDQRTCVPADRAPPQKFKPRYSASTRAFSSGPYPTPQLPR